MSFTDPVLESDSITHWRLSMNALQTKTNVEEVFLNASSFTLSTTTQVTFDNVLKDTIGTFTALMPGNTFIVPWTITGTDGATYLEAEVFLTWDGCVMPDEMDPISDLRIRVWNGASVTYLDSRYTFTVNGYPNEIGTQVYRGITSSLGASTPIRLTLYPTNIILSNVSAYLRVRKIW